MRPTSLRAYEGAAGSEDCCFWSFCAYSAGPLWAIAIESPAAGCDSEQQFPGLLGQEVPPMACPCGDAARRRRRESRHSVCLVLLSGARCDEKHLPSASIRRCAARSVPIESLFFICDPAAPSRLLTGRSSRRLRAGSCVKSFLASPFRSFSVAMQECAVRCSCHIFAADLQTQMRAPQVCAS